MRKCRGRIVASILAFALILTSGGLSVLAEGENGQQTTDVSDGQQAESAGQNGTASGQDSQTGDETESTNAQTAEEQQTEEQSEGSASVVISQWSWVDEDGILQEDNGVWGIGMPGASEENPLTQDALAAMLPSQIQAVTADGETVTLDITWDLSAIPEEGIWSGDQVFTASLPEGYQLAEGVSGLSVTVQMGGAETYAPLPSGTPPFSNRLVNGVSPNGTTIDLFDYWLTQNQTDSDENDPSDFLNRGINNGHALIFGRNINATHGDWNEYHSGNSKDPVTGIVADNLVNGYPQLDVDTSTASNSTISGRSGSESLAYLFDPSVQSSGKASYEDVKGLLQVDDEGYYYYNSQKNYAAYYSNSNSFALYDLPGVKPDGKSPVGQFFPFNAANVGGKPYYYNGNNDEQGWYYLMNDNGSDSSNLNHYFGVHMSTRFVQQYGGYTDDISNKNRRQVTYEFSGDDDVWIFIDDVLVADLGGIHDAASVDINFATGVIKINGTAQRLTLGQILGTGSNTLTDNTYHTLDFFYLERGNVDSNMNLKYNLVTIPESSVIKVDQTGDPVAGAEFELYAAKHMAAPIATGVTNADGEFIFVDNNDFPITIAQLYEQYKDEGTGEEADLILRETLVPDGYRSNGDLELRFFAQNGEVLLLSNNQWDVGAYAMSKVTTTAPDMIIEANNGGRSVDLTETQNPLMFGVVFQKQENGQWYPVYGDPLNGWHVTDGNSWSDIEEAARANPYVFQLASSGAYQINIDNLPGDIQTYYHICQNSEKAEYTVAYYYTTSATISGLNDKNTWRIEPEAQNEANQFDRVFSVNMYVPNIKNRLFVQKVDDAGTPLNGVEFALYKKDQVIVADDGTVTPNPDVSPYDSRTTEHITQTIDLDGGGVFPTSQKGILETGEYYLFETSGLSGYVKNDTAVHIIVDSTGVYADAGTAGDGISVLKGVGSIVKSMVQFATDDNVDTTLNAIKAGLQTGIFSGYDLDGSFDWNSDIQWDSDDILHLQYANQYNVLDYGLTGATEKGNVNTLTLKTDTGWSRLAIRQCYQHDDTTDVSLKENLGERDITSLFSGTTIVRVENQRSNSLTLSKTVVNAPTDIQTGQKFEFTLTMSEVTEEQKNAVYPVEGTGTTETIQFSDGMAKVTLKHGESIRIISLPTGAKVQITESDIPGQTYNTTYVVGNGSSVDSKETGELDITDSGSVNVAFTNTYVPTGDFSFTKTDKDENPLGDATFALYRLECEDKNHDHSDDEIKVDENGSFQGGYEYTDCWTLVQTATSNSGTGEVKFTAIPTEGEYRLVEMKTPDGYEAPGGQWKIVYNNGMFQPKGDGDASVGNPPAIKVDGEGINAKYSIINYQPGELPFSGNTGIKMFLIIGGILMLGGAVGTVWYLRRKRRLA